MINFFRKMRQDSIEDGKTERIEWRTGRYLKYALGEILLVMIGILLALQVNNWNEQRKEAEKQNRLFSNLKIDFQNRLNELEDFYMAKSKAIENIIKLNLIISKHENGFDESEVIGLLATLLNNFFFNEAFELLEGVFNTGLINDIKNEKLKRKLIEWPQLVEEMLEEQRILHNDNRTKYQPLLDRYISIRKLFEQFDYREYALPRGTPTTLEENFSGLMSDPLLENYLANKELLLRVSLIDNANLIAAAKEIIDLLEENLPSD